MLIGLGHRSRVGKNSAANFIADWCRSKGKNPKICAFADKLKEIAHRLYDWAGVHPAEYYEQNPNARSLILPELNMTVVDLWIKLGTPAIREQIYQDTWVKCLEQKYMYLDYDSLIITDLRFPNEFKWIQSKGGICIQVRNPRIPNRDSVADEALAGNHPWDAIIHNDGSLEQLRQKTIAIMERLNV